MLRVINLLLTLMILLAVASCTASFSTAEVLDPVAAGESAQIYAAAIREIHSYALSSELVYVLSTTEDLVYADAPLAPAGNLAAELQAAISTELEGAAFELVWIDAADQAPSDPANGEIAGGDGILVRLGNIHPQDDGSVLLSFFMTCADMCGVGKTFVLEKSFAAWEVTGSVGPEIAS